LTARAGGGVGSQTGLRDCRDRGFGPGTGRQGSNHDDPYCLHHARRPGEAWRCRQPRPARRQRDRDQFFSIELAAKRLELLRELVPTATRVAVLVNPADPTNAETMLRDVEAASRAMGLQVQVIDANTSLEIDAAFAAFVRDRPDALFVAPDGFFVGRRVQLIALAARHALPAAYGVRDFVETGGLMSYGTSSSDMYRQVGVYTGHILKGTKPAELPVVRSTKFEFVINLQTARALGLDVPLHLQQLADEVIE
jgi:putative ABC transport system substrate-binding protein